MSSLWPVSLHQKEKKYYKLWKPLYSACKLEMASLLETNSIVVFCTERWIILACLLSHWIIFEWSNTMNVNTSMCNMKHHLHEFDDVYRLAPWAPYMTITHTLIPPTNDSKHIRIAHLSISKNLNYKNKFSLKVTVLRDVTLCSLVRYLPDYLRKLRTPSSV